MNFIKFQYTEKNRKGEIEQKEIGLRPMDVIFVFKEGENCTRLKVRGERRKVVYSVDVNEPFDSVLEKLNQRALEYKKRIQDEGDALKLKELRHS